VQACEDKSDGNKNALDNSPTASYKSLVALLMAQLRAKSRKVKDCTHKVGLCTNPPASTVCSQEAAYPGTQLIEQLSCVLVQETGYG
jgi:hypothetical protein